MLIYHLCAKITLQPLLSRCVIQLLPNLRGSSVDLPFHMVKNQLSTQPRSFWFSFDNHTVIALAMAFRPPETIA
ncbi:MAG: hypothetical protein V7K53_09130 [Nostoc sp.]|uniref:hypothetical protein n=1 Tax=Nostoc sp. TaxID=1180 RepID=UPI002FF74DF9